MLSTLGAALVDEFCWKDSAVNALRDNELRMGGGGVYATVGARVWTKNLGQLVHRGPDFPPALQAQLDTFGDIWRFRDTPTPTPRALNTFYPPSPSRHFRYLVHPPRLSLSELAAEPNFTSLRMLHLCCAPSDLQTQILPALSACSRAPKLCFEPIPFACKPEALATLRSSFSYIYLFSPNHEEAGAFFGFSPAEMEDPGAIERVAQLFRREGAGRIIIRSGALGAYVFERQKKDGVWVKPYHRDPTLVRDTCGAGNSFLGGTMAGLQKYPEDLVLAARHGSVSAGIVVESIGLPELTVGEDGVELWNGKSARDRLSEMVASNT
ncbi:hypothetical protein JCM11641_001157 [Rhodosporidiobolus odoratus]